LSATLEQCTSSSGDLAGDCRYSQRQGRQTPTPRACIGHVYVATCGVLHSCQSRGAFRCVASHGWKGGDGRLERGSRGLLMSEGRVCHSMGSTAHRVRPDPCERLLQTMGSRRLSRDRPSIVSAAHTRGQGAAEQRLKGPMASAASRRVCDRVHDRLCVSLGVLLSRQRGV